MSEKPSGIICTPNELAFSSANPAALHCLTRGDTVGLMLITQSSYVSLIALVYVFSVILLNVFLLYLHPEKRKKGLKLFHQPMDLLMLSLFVADTLQAIGGAVNAKWVDSGKVEAGTFCDAQGIIQNVGETAVALSNLTISVYTFFSLWLRKNILSMKLTLGVIACIWLFIAVIVIAGNATHRNPRFSLPTPYWCWISQEYLVWRIVAEYMWFWIALLLSLLVYVPLLWVRNISRDRLRQAFIFLAYVSDLRYPLTYCFCIIPLSIVRWIGFMQEKRHNRNDTPSAVIFFASSIFTLGGFLNVVLLLSTRPNSGLFGKLVFEPPMTGSLPEVNGVTEERRGDSPQDQGRLP